jgi:hypothetical protein
VITRAILLGERKIVGGRKKGGKSMCACQRIIRYRIIRGSLGEEREGRDICG